MKEGKLTQNILKNYLHYNSETGIFTWITNRIKSRVGCTAGSITSGGYISIGMLSEYYYAHRLAWLYTYGSWPTNQIDHINKLKNDNRIINLRSATPRENCSNKTNNNTEIGVQYRPDNNPKNPWEARVWYINKLVYLGCFDSEEKGRDEYNLAISEIEVGKPPSTPKVNKTPKGYTYDPRYNKWYGRFRHNLKTIYLGSFNSEEEVAAAVQTKREELK